MKDLYAVSAPGQIITFSYQLFGCLFVWMNRRRFSAAVTILIEVCGTALLVALANAIESPDLRFYFPRFFMFLGLTFGLMFLCMKESPRKCLYFLPFAFIYAEFTTALEWQAYYFGTRIRSVADIPQIRIPFFVSVYLAVFLITFMLYRPFRKYHSEMTVRRQDLVQVFVLAAIIFLVSNISNVYQDSVFSAADPMQVFRLRTAIDLAGALAMYLFHVAKKGYSDQLQAEMLSETMRQMQENYRISKESVELVSEKYHDLKHQILYLKKEAAKPEGREALEQMEQEIADFEAQADTGNEVLDTILMSKRLAWKKEDISIVCIADGAAASFMDGMDQAALFGNLLDNAIEAVLKLPTKEERLINLTVERKKGFLLITAENRCAGTPVIRDGLPVTDKADARNHGYGTRSIRSIAEKYGGSANFSVENGWFRVKVMIPLKDL